MFIRVERSGYNRDDQQICHGEFLYLMQCREHGNSIRALIRHTRMSQCGHFMMGYVFINKTKIVISGTYGSDGLPDDVPEEIWKLGHQLPADLEALYWSSGGHNGPGEEATRMRQWARQNFALLKALNKGDHQ